jgi:hypothetical protein
MKPRNFISESHVACMEEMRNTKSMSEDLKDIDDL